MVNTLEDVVYMGMKNDVSFLFTEVLNLYEHQSTFNPNLPLRGLLYFSKLYQKIIGPRKDLYSEKLIELPYPQFVVFYNGTKEEPERQVLELRAAFPKEYSKENAALQCRAIDECINQGILADILREDCEEVRSMLLTEYDEQAHIKNEKEISYEEGIRKGEDLLSILIQHLLAAGRMDDVKRVTTDAQYRRELYKEFGLQTVIQKRDYRRNRSVV